MAFRCHFPSGTVAMVTDSWSNLRSSSSSPRYRSRSDRYCEARGEGDAAELRVEYTCPFCAEDFDIVGLYCHMDEEHPLAVKNGVCPVCTEIVGQEIVVHITTQHGSVLKKQRKGSSHRKRASSSIFSALRNQLREGNFQSHNGGSLRTSSSFSLEPDPLLSLFLFNPATDAPMNAKPGSPPDESPAVTTSSEQSSKSEMDAQKSPTPRQDQVKAAQKCEIVQWLMLSIILDDDL